MIPPLINKLTLVFVDKIYSGHDASVKDRLIGNKTVDLIFKK